MFALGMLRPGSLWTPATAPGPASLLAAGRREISAALDARRVDGELPAWPTEPPAAPAALSPATAEAAPPAGTAASPGVRRPTDSVIQASAGFCRCCNEVRVTNKASLNQRRAELRKRWPDFEKTYDTYRQWRDCRSDDPAYPKLAEEGLRAQREIMNRSGVRGSGEEALFKLLSAGNSDLLRYVSPINGDFRAPGAGIVAGLRFETVRNGDKETRVPVLAFPGTGSGAMIRAQMKTNIAQFLGLGGPPRAYLLGAELARAIGSQFPPGSAALQLVGHSLGGGAASFSAAMNDLPCVSFNPAALGGASLRHLQNHCPTFQRTSQKQTIIRVKNDHVSSPAMQSRLAAVLRIHPRFETPTHIGNVHVIPREQLPEKHRGTLELHNLRSIVAMYDAAAIPPGGRLPTATV